MNRTKQDFLESNADIKEVEVNELSISDNFHNIDELYDDVWLMQCPKGTDINEELKGKLIKLQGRTNINDELEIVTMDLPTPTTHTFGFCNKKGKYDIRTLPIRGNIMLRKRFKPSHAITEEGIEGFCLQAARVPFPENIRIRHPLLGANYAAALDIDRSIVERLRVADKNSSTKFKRKPLDDDDEEDVIFLNETQMPKSKDANTQKKVEINGNKLNSKKARKG